MKLALWPYVAQAVLCGDISGKFTHGQANPHNMNSLTGNGLILSWFVVKGPEWHIKIVPHAMSSGWMRMRSETQLKESGTG